MDTKAWGRADKITKRKITYVEVIVSVEEKELSLPPDFLES